MGTPVIHGAVLPGRDEVHLEIELAGDQNTIVSARLRALGCPELLDACARLRPLLRGKLREIALPTGNSHPAMLLREVLLRARGEWQLPYMEDELCHCRAVPTAKVDAAIVGGAHDVASVSRRTSAGTSCGSCQPDIQALLKYRLPSKP
ncbi:MAG: (2Fe-2S)-binding protein [Bdellovibrionaceae bacterium]|nr:(2Fe-2S)-binding protein [Pseudobdellovibrionaceae bacterium]